MRSGKLCGYDLNGWHDFAARNWIVQLGEGEDYSGTVVSDGGILSSIVRTGDGRDTRWIGGIQGALAPHGRGEGWGEIGRRERRMSVLRCLSVEAKQIDPLVGALRGLVQGAEQAVLAIDDLPSTTEADQERLLAAMTAAGVSSKLVVWRPVLSVLRLIEPLALRDKQLIGVICHSADGFSLQALRIRREAGNSSSMLAPERCETGRLLRSSLGYRTLVSRAREQVLEIAGNDHAAHLEEARSVGLLSLGRDAPREILRLANGDWLELIPPERLSLPDCDLRRADFDTLADCDLLLFETHSEGFVRARLVDHLEAVIGKTLVPLSGAGVAEGGLIAAQRLAAGDPVFFDFLPQISTIVQGAGGATNFDLIKADATLPAGHLYRSERPARLGIQAGQKSFSVYLRKETEPWPRKAVVDLGNALAETAPVDLWVEQAPVAGRAKIWMQSARLSRQFSVEWDDAEELRKEWGEIIDNLATPLPSIPTRLVLPCGLYGWRGANGNNGLSAFLLKSVNARNIGWARLANKLSQRPFRKYCVSSDGEFPDGLDADSVANLESITGKAVKHVRDRVNGQVVAGNHSLRFLTWQFRRCPKEIAELLLNVCSDQDLARVIAPKGPNWVLVYQGIGRVAYNPDFEKRALTGLFKKPVSAWNWRRETACAAFMLSRSDTAPLLLDRQQVDRLARRVVLEFRDNMGTNYAKFSYAPFLLVGLLRWRLKEPGALVAGQDPAATDMVKVLEKALAEIQRKVNNVRNSKKYIKILKDTHAELGGEGTNPDLLLDIYGAV